MANETKRFVYADNAATTPVLKEVIAEMQPYFESCWGNPSSIYRKGLEAKHAITDARERIASHLGCTAKELFFTSCGSESDNWAIKGAVAATGKKHIITTKIEHPAVLRSADALAKFGCRVTKLDVDSYGIVRLDQLEQALDDDTAVVAIMTANNEIGTIEPIAEAAKLAHKAGALMFTDAVQAMGAIPLNVDELGVDMLSFSGHKIGAPKGIGGLYVRRGVRINRYLDGGAQESGRRAGTENVPYIMALAKAVDLAHENMADNDRIRGMRDRLITELLKIPYSSLNGHPTSRLPGNTNITFQYIEGESMRLLLDMNGICVSTGSACSSASLEPSHVLVSCGVPVEHAHGSLRISLGHQNTDEDVDYILEKLPSIVARLRAMSPIYPG
ncbi:MAG: cysteine desulfurase NifS [Clostridia bacterium]|nr:cysteine desulfurase NifS [Clostridia bacterium]